MTRAPLPLRILSAALSVVETAAVLVVGLVIVARALARGAQPAEGLDDDCDGSGPNGGQEPRKPLIGGLDDDCDDRRPLVAGRIGDTGLRDPKFPCEDYEPGETRPAADCETDGHYLCKRCRHARVAACPHANVRRDFDHPGFARCEDCGETDFPATPEAAGACPACGEYGDCECVPAGPRPHPHCATWIVLPSGKTVGLSPLGDPLTGVEA